MRVVGSRLGGPGSSTCGDGTEPATEVPAEAERSHADTELAATDHYRGAAEQHDQPARKTPPTRSGGG